ncbi:MAG: HAD hydrolase family protein, partial [Minisyncoccia bacterium]
GIQIAFITSEKEGFFEPIIEKLNNLPSVKEGRWPPVALFMGDAGKNKSETIGKWLSESSISLDECAYMGDDLGDYEIMQKVGFAAAPAQAEDIIKKISHFIAARRGGDGAIRDFVNYILKEKNIDPTTLSLK